MRFELLLSALSRHCLFQITSQMSDSVLEFTILRFEFDLFLRELVVAKFIIFETRYGMKICGERDTWSWPTMLDWYRKRT